MASRSGPRAEGTDGSDFSHREKIADHYTKSAELKASVRKCLIPHIVLFVCLILKAISLALKSTYFLPLENWEMAWGVSGIFAWIGLRSLPKNDTRRLSSYIVGNICFGIAPLAYGVYVLVNKLLADFQDIKNAPKEWKNSPTKMAIVAVCLSWQVTGAFHAIRLVRAWGAMAGKKKK